MENKRREFTKEFKKQAVELAEECNSYAAAGRKLGVCESVIRKWVKNKKRDVAIKNYDANAGVAELEQLRKENAELKKVNCILKAAAAVFCQDQLK